MTTDGELTIAMMENSIENIIKELGYAFTSSVGECKRYMVNFGAHEPTPNDVVRIISVMLRYHVISQDDPKLETPGNFWSSTHETKNAIAVPPGESWNAEVFVKTLKELTPNLNWKEVILQLDHPEFIVPDRQALSLLFAILKLGLQSSGYPVNLFPVEVFFRQWSNLEGQMSLITSILKNPDTFSFSDHPVHIVSIDVLRSVPEVDNEEIATWRCVPLVDFLLYAAQKGYYIQVQELLKFPIQHCPDVMLLTLLQTSSPITPIRQELLTNLIQIFLGNHPNSGSILHHVWHAQIPNIKPIIMHAMADWYIKGDGDQSKLSRILDIAQDLKALSFLLNVQSFLFAIDLACLASRREYLKLDKWLTDKIREHGETFVSAMVKFLQRKCPQVIGGKFPEELPKPSQLPPETIGIISQCLQLCINKVQADLSDAICSVISNCQTYLMTKTITRNPSMPRQPIMDSNSPFNPSGLNSPGFGGYSVDTISSLTANMSFGTPVNAFGQSSTLGTSASPSRMMGNSFMMPLPRSLDALAQMAPAPKIDKPRIVENPIVIPELENVSKEIEDEANSYFQRIYNHPPYPTLSIDEVLIMLKKFQESPNTRENKVFSCMLKNLFEEYKFFPQYPDKELLITAQLFGGIIEKGLVPSYVSLGLALRYILDALRKPEGSKMYYFGIAALDRFKFRLKDYQKYCEHVRGIPHFNQFPPHLIEYVEYGLQSQEPPMKPQGSVLPSSLANMLSQNVVATVSSPYRSIVSTPTTISIMSKITTTATCSPIGRPSIANATNIDTLLTATDQEEKITNPPENVQDKSAFIFNNLSQLNLQTKCDELRDIICEEYYPWLAQYLVMKRASIELNFHSLYSNFLDELKAPEINKMVIKETFRNIKVLLLSDKGIANFSDRSLLKNLGHWLGMLTLGRNLPILHHDLDVKSLILEAYHKGQQDLLYVVPFVAKILESCAKSVVFKPPNPWTMGIMNVLAELHGEPDLKLNLKFEIEVLCKNLSIDVSDLKPVVYLKETSKPGVAKYQLSHSKKEETPMLPITQMRPPATPSIEEMTVRAVTPSGVPMNDPIVNFANMPEPRFNYFELNTSSATAFEQNISFNPQIIIFQNYPQLKQLVKPAIERSIQEWLHPVVDRSVKYALTTCEHIIRKDFALDPNEIRMRECAHSMMRSLTAGMAMITCREPLVTTISKNLKEAFLLALIPATSQQKEIIELAASTLATENMELACAFIQKAAVEKALTELDKNLLRDYEIRKLARQESRIYFDPIVASYQYQNIPEMLRMRPGGVSGSQMSVYEEFACNIPGFMPSRTSGLYNPKPDFQMGQDRQMSAQDFHMMSQELNMSGQKQMLPQELQMTGQVRQMIAKELQMASQEVQMASQMRQITSQPLQMTNHEPQVFSQVLNPTPIMYGGDEFNGLLVNNQRQENGISEFVGFEEAMRPYLGDRAPMDPIQQIHVCLHHVRTRDYEDPPGLAEKTENLLREWIAILHSPLNSIEITKNFNIFLHRMNMAEILKSDDLITRFLRIGTQICIENVYKLLSEEKNQNIPVVRSKFYKKCDAFVRLVALLVKNLGNSANVLPKINLVNKVLGIIAGCLLQDHEVQGTRFQQLPYHRLLLMLFLDLNQPEAVLEAINYEVLTSFCHTLRLLRPSVAPGFSYAWLELVAHRAFIGRLLATTPQQKGWSMYSSLLIDLFQFLKPFLRNTELKKPTMALYKGTLKVLLIILHDFPEFLCDYHYVFCDEIPPNCIQLRNLILSAFPRNMRLPDPFMPSLKVDLLPEISLPPRGVTNFSALVERSEFKKDMDNYLASRAPVTFLTDLRRNMQVSADPDERYNGRLINAVVVYVGNQAIAHITGRGQSPNMSTIAHSAHMDIYQNLSVDLDYEGRYLFFNAISNQLRYPNSHTHYYSCVLLYLFSLANAEAIQEQITRILLERLIVNRPHPWGLLITFIELIKNPVYKFWDHDFVHCAKEIERLFESVARSCNMDKSLTSNSELEIAY